MAVNLESPVFQDDLDFKVLEDLLETLDHIKPIRISRDEYNAKKGDILKKTGSDKLGDFYDLYLPEDLKVGELLFFINFLNKEFGLDEYSKINEIISKVKVMVGIIFRLNEGQEDADAYLESLAEEYNLDKEFIERIRKQKLKPSKETKDFIRKVKKNRIDWYKKDKLGRDEDLENSNSELSKLFSTEFDLTFFRKGINMLRLGMETINRAEQMALKGKEGITPNVNDEELDQKAKLLRDDIGMDNLKKELEEAKKSGNQEKIAEKEIEATNRILEKIHKYPYQSTENEYGYQPNKIAQYKEIYCVGFSLLGHAFLSELGIHHKGLSIPKHSALEIDIGGKMYYFDGTSESKIYEFNYGENVGVYRKIDLVLGKFNEDIIAVSGDTENILLSQIYNNKGSDLVDLNRYEEAIEMYNKALELDPTHSYAFNNKGKVLYGLKRYEEAIEMYDKALELNPKYSIAFNNKGSALENLNRYEEAIEMYNKILELDPTCNYVYHFIWPVLKKVGKQKLSELYKSAFILLTGKDRYLNIILYGNEKQKIRDFIDRKDYEGLRNYLLELEKDED